MKIKLEQTWDSHPDEYLIMPIIKLDNSKLDNMYIKDIISPLLLEANRIGVKYFTRSHDYSIAEGIDILLLRFDTIDDFILFKLCVDNDIYSFLEYKLELKHGWGHFKPHITLNNIRLMAYQTSHIYVDEEG